MPPVGTRCVALLMGWAVLAVPLRLADAQRLPWSPLPLIAEAPLRRLDAQRSAQRPAWARGWSVYLQHLWCPLPTDYRTKRVSAAVSAKARAEAAGLLEQTLRPEYLPPDIEGRLVGLREWQAGRDCLMVQYARGTARLQLIVSGCVIGILVADTTTRAAANEAAAVGVAKGVLVGRPDPNAEPGSGSEVISGYTFGALWVPRGGPVPTPWNSVQFVAGPGFVFLAIPRWTLDRDWLGRKTHAYDPPPPAKLFD